MSDVKAVELSEAQREAQIRAASLAADYKEVFGLERTRSDPQRRVLADLKRAAGGDGCAYRKEGATDGISLIVAGIARDAARSLLNVIDFQLERAQRPSQKKLVKPSVKK